MRCHFILLLLLMFGFKALTQSTIPFIEKKERNIDSLKKVLSKASAKERVDILNELAVAYYSLQNDSLLNFAQQAYKEALSIHYHKGLSLSLCYQSQLESVKSKPKQADSLASLAIESAMKSQDEIQIAYSHYTLGFIKIASNEYHEAIKQLEIAEGIYKKGNDVKRLSRIYFLKASSYLKMNRLYDGLKKLNEAARLNKQGGDLDGYSDALHNMGEIYFNLKEYSTAISYYQQSIKAGAPLRYQNSWGSHHKMGNAYLDAKNYDSALLCYHQAMSIIDQMVKDSVGKRHQLFQTEVKIGEAYVGLGQADKALQLLLPFYEHYKAKKDANRLVQVLPKLGAAYLYKKEFAMALAYGREMLPYCAKSKSGTGYKKAYDILAGAFENLNRPDSAFYYLKLSTAIQDSIDKENFKSNTNFYKAMVENESSESKIEILNKDNQLKQQKLNLLIGGLIGLFVLALAFVGYLNVKHKNERHRRTLAENELQIEKLQSEKKQVSLRHHASELEMQVLRAQMNPHFIFNCLNAINHFILKNETETASDYLTKFSRLIRQVLQNSSKKTIALSDELSTLQLYIELEQVRFKNRFQFTISVNENIDTEGLMIPPMLLQPFVENAIWHGLMQKEEAGELNIDISQQNDSLLCTVTDNGIGRQNTVKNRNQATQKKSMGLQITADRLRMLEGENGKGTFTIVDLKDDEGNNSGTKVIVTIPAAIADTVAA